MLIGYLMTRAADADTFLAQRQALADAGCTLVVKDLGDGSRWTHPELRRLLDGLREGDVVVVPKLDCLGRSLPDVVRRMGRITAAGAGLRSLAEAMDTTTPEGQAVARMVGNLAALDRDAVRGRIGVGLAVARAAGRKGGRRPKLTERQRAAIAGEVLSGRRTAAQMAELHKVSAPTISRLVAAYRACIGASVLRHPDGEGATDREGRIAGVLPMAALDERLAIVGTSGSGKTYAAKGLVERLMRQGARVCVVDPLGVWWGLRDAPDGAPSGYPVVVFGSAHADVALDPGIGPALGRLVSTPFRLRGGLVRAR